MVPQSIVPSEILARIRRGGEINMKRKKEKLSDVFGFIFRFNYFERRGANEEECNTSDSCMEKPYWTQKMWPFKKKKCNSYKKLYIQIPNIFNKFLEKTQKQSIVENTPIKLRFWNAFQEVNRVSSGKKIPHLLISMEKKPQDRWNRNKYLI